ncbi:uncharacterized protein LOC5573526 [Aedes aegypti]|uniref:DUF7775 domain-containing protein n=2 Tax=Aedes aegypti TaxID=7159 RepID=A0A903UME3_AEDAE|nr:uncharacterized protein LOC5573526 [Aedes aegypti]
MPENNSLVPPPRIHHSPVPSPPSSVQQQQQQTPSPVSCPYHAANGTLVSAFGSTSSGRPPLSIIKFLELCLAVACTVLHYYSFDDGDLVTGFLATGTFCGYIVILTTVMVGYLMKAHIHRRLNLFYSLLGCALFLTAGIFIIEAWEHAFRTRTRDLAITKGSIAIINGVIFLMDTIFTFRERK